MKMKLAGAWIFLIFCLSLSVYSQSQEATLSGTTRDTGGAVVSDASVLIVEQRTGARRESRTDETGRFSFASLPPGMYKIKVIAAGFEEVELKDVDPALPASRDISIALSIRVKETMIVSVRRRDERLQDVPGSVTALDEEELKQKQVDRTDDLTLHVPNLNFYQTRSSYSNGAIFIRGIGQEDTVFTVDAGVGMYLDDVLLPRSQGALVDLYDVERVEVLRGPQGTLYGRNTIAGAIRIITKQPANDLSGGVEFTTGSYKRADLKGHINLPIVPDKLLTRIALANFYRDGFEFNQFTGKRTSSREGFSGRGTLLYRPNENVDVTFRLDGVRERPSIRVGALLRPQVTALDFPGLLAGRLVTIPAGTDDPFRVRANVEDKNDVDTWGVSGALDWRMSNAFSLRSVTSYRSLESDSRIDFDGTEARLTDAFALQDHRQASQELQLSHFAGSRWNTIGGLFFFYEHDDQFDGTDGTAKGFSIDSMYEQRTLSSAAYAQTSYRLTEDLSFTGGLRFTYETKRFSRISEQHVANINAPDSNLFGGFGRGPGAVPPLRFPGNGRRITDIRDATEDWGALTPRIGLQYRGPENALIYGSVARGFKSGGFNGRANEAANPLQREPYKPEYVWTYELGTKTSWLNRRLFFNPNFFYNDYTDLQLASFSTPNNGETFLPLFTNAGKAVTRGFELDLSAYPVSRLQLFASAGYTDSKFLEFLERGRDLSDVRELPNAPKWTATFSGVYAIPISRSGYLLRIGGDLNYQGKRFLTVSNLPDLLQPAYSVINAFTSLEPPSRRWRISLNGRNLADERYMVAGLDASPLPFGIVTGFFGDPRTMNVTFAVRFGRR